MKIKIDGISDYIDSPAFNLNRRLGQSTAYNVSVPLNQTTGNLLDSVASKLKDNTNKVSLFLDDKSTSLFVGLELINCSFEDTEHSPGISLHCITNKIQNYSPGPFQQRNRILKAQNLKELFKNYFRPIVELDNTIQAALEKVKFPDKEKTNLVQYKKTDYEMVGDVISWYNSFVQPKETIIISGSADNDRLQLKWIQDAKCAELNYTKSRKLDDKVAGSLKPSLRIGFAEMQSPKLYRQENIAQNIIYIVNQGNWEQGSWKNWKKIELPAYYKESYVYQIRDSLSDENTENLSWQSQIATLPNSSTLDFPCPNSIPWSGLGKVINRSSKDHWLVVELDEFEKDSNKADVRVSTQYSGHKGNSGFHLVPEKGTEVHVIKGSNWLSPIVFLSNVRSENTTGDAPFWKLEDTTHWDFQSANIKVKDITTAAEDTVVVKTKGVKTKMDSSKMEIS